MWQINFCVTYRNRLVDEEEAVEKANDQFEKDLKTIKVKDFGMSVEEI